MPSTHELDDLLTRARLEPGVAEVMRVYKNSQKAMQPAIYATQRPRIVSTSSANLLR